MSPAPRHGSPPPGSDTPTALADQAEARADGLRTSIADFLETDEAVGFEVFALRSFMVEER